MILMNQIPDLPVDINVGGSLSTIKCKPLTPYSLHAIEFLSALSKALLGKSEIRQYPDIAAFAYWCRKANIERLAHEFGTQNCRIGRGVVFHIVPANAPVNFAFSFAFGVLAGNANIVRLPGVSHPQSDIICKEIARLFDCQDHSQIAVMNRLIKYSRNDEITATISAACHARVLWGGDSTISHLRTIPTSPRCIDITFADRYSLCLLDAKAILDADDRSIEELASGFFNDVYFLDQNACSSPHLILWQGHNDQVELAMKRFWSAMYSLLQQKYVVTPIQALDKFVLLCQTAITLPDASAFTQHINFIYRVRLDALPPDIDDHRGQHGFFYEFITEDLNCLTNIVDERYQTLTCYGVDLEAVIEFIVNEGLTGIDRVVHVGKALDIGVYWDGYDLIGTLSRIVHNQ